MALYCPGSRAEVRFYTDSRSALQAIAARPTLRSGGLLGDVLLSLSALSRRCHLTLQWVPAHCGIAGNEAADALAATAAPLEQRKVPVARDAALALLRRTARASWLEGRQPEWHRRMAGPTPRLINLPRTDAVTVAQLRTGHCSMLASYRHRIGLATSPNCPDCGDDQEDSAAHFLLECPAHHRLRIELFNFSPLMTFDPRSPADVAAFARRAGRARPRVWGCRLDAPEIKKSFKS